MDDVELIRDLRASGRPACLRLADLLSLAVDPAYGAQRLLDDVRHEGMAKGKRVDVIFPATADELLYELRETALGLLGNSNK